MSIISEEIRVRQRAIEYAIKHNNNAKAAKKYHTSRQQIQRWRKRYDGTPQSLLPLSRRPKSHPNEHTKDEIELILSKYKKFRFEGLAEVYVQCKKRGYTRTYDSMCKIIRKNREEEKEKPIKIRSKYKVEKVSYPGEKVQIDIKYIPRECIKFGTRDMNYYQITAIDEYTRKRVLEVVDEKSTYQTAKFLEKLEERFGFKIKTIQTDNGKEFTNGEDGKKTLFELKLEEKGIEYKKIRPYSPWQNGKVERSHREDSKFYLRREFKSKEELIKSVKKYCNRYNNISKKVLGFKSPNEVLKEYNKTKVA